MSVLESGLRAGKRFWDVEVREGHSSSRLDPKFRDVDVGRGLSFRVLCAS